MEEDGVGAAAPTTTTSAVLVAIPPHDPDYSPVGSPEIIDSHLEEVLVLGEEEDHHHPQIASALTDDLRDKIIKQVNVLSVCVCICICVTVYTCRQLINGAKCDIVGILHGQFLKTRCRILSR